jgi:hypothetical protein
MEKQFREYGLPEALRTDNGEPFASVGIGGLSQLAVWLIKLGIRPERIEVGCPQQNGRHERFHLTLKQAVISPPRDSLVQQQKAFDQFKIEYNQERPHEALNQKPPASLYRPSLKPYPAKLAEVEYGRDCLVRQVKHNGWMRWKGGFIYVSKTLNKEPIGLQQIDNQLYAVYYSFYPLGILDETVGRIIPK